MNTFKKFVTILAAAPMLWACSAEEGTEPGSDPNPVVTLYTYAPADENLNPDNDVTVRFVTNNKATSVKYLLLTSAEAENIINNGGDAALLAKVEADGNVVDGIKANSYAEVTLTDIHGDYTIAAVANGTNLAGSIKFLGLEWNVVKEGVFNLGSIGSSLAGVAQVEASLEVCTTDETLYRIENAFGEGKHLKMYMTDDKGYNDDGDEYTIFRVRPTLTPLSYEDLGRVYVRDIAYAYNYQPYATDPSYCNGMYKNGRAFFRLQWYVSTRSLGLAVSTFVPND